MSYIVVLFNLPPHIVSFTNLTDDDEGESAPLGSREAILALLTSLYPDADQSDPTWVCLKREEFVIEFMLGDADPIDSMGLRIHGGDQAMEVAKELCAHTGWRAYDTSLGDFIIFDDNAAAGLQAWRDYRDRVIKPPSSESR